MTVRDFSQTNSVVARIVSAGAAYTWTLPFQPDMIEWWNYTTWNTANVATTDEFSRAGVWFRGFPAGDGLITLRIIDNGTTGLGNIKLETTNAVTLLSDGTGFAATQITPTAINGTTGIVTAADHGLVTGQYVRATDFRATPVASATGMYALNNLLWQVVVLSSSTFQLYYPQTNMMIPFDPNGQVAFVNNGIAQFNLVGTSLNTENPPPVFQVTLGSNVMDGAGDVIYVRASQANLYQNITA